MFPDAIKRKCLLATLLQSNSKVAISVNEKKHNLLIKSKVLPNLSIFLLNLHAKTKKDQPFRLQKARKLH